MANHYCYPQNGVFCINDTPLMEKKAETYSVISNITRVASGQFKIRRFSVATDATDLTSGDSDMDSHVSERILGYAVAKFFRGCTIASALHNREADVFVPIKRQMHRLQSRKKYVQDSRLNSRIRPTQSLAVAALSYLHSPICPKPSIF